MKKKHEKHEKKEEHKKKGRPVLSNAVLLFVFFLCVWVCVNSFGFPDIFFLDFFFVVFLCDVADVVAVAVVVGLINRRPITQRLSTRESPKKTKQKK